MRVAFMRLWAVGEGEAPPANPPAPDPSPASPPANPPAAPPWIGQLPSDLKGNEVLTKFGTIGDLAGDYLKNQGRLVELDGKVSKMIPRLPEKPTADDLKAFRGSMGIPESPDKYDLKRINWPTDKMGEYPQQVEDAFRQFAHEKNMTPEQVQGVYDWYMQNILNAGADMEKIAERRRAEGAEHLKKLWGDKYVENSEKATRAFWFYATPEDMTYFEESGMADNPRLIKMFHRIYLHTANDNMVRDAKPPLPADQQPKVDGYGKPRLSYPSMEQKK